MSARRGLTCPSLFDVEVGLTALAQRRRPRVIQSSRHCSAGRFRRGRLSLALAALACWPMSVFFLACSVVGQEVDATTAVDVYGDALPTGATARLGTTRFRTQSNYSRLFRISDDGTVASAASALHGVVAMDAATGKRLASIDFRPLQVGGLALSRDGKLMAVGGVNAAGEREGKAEIRIFDLAAGGRLAGALTREAEEAGPQAMSFSPDGRSLISFDANGIVRVEDLESGAELARVASPERVKGAGCRASVCRAAVFARRPRAHLRLSRRLEGVASLGCEERRKRAHVEDRDRGN
jgi:hypothetical protein